MASKTNPPTPPAPKKSPAPIDDYSRLLVQVAGSVAAGLASSPSPSITSSAAMATAALDIAEQILAQAGIEKAS